MADNELTQILLAQTWQITLLIVVVAGINRWLSRRRPHLAHALWLVVLVKCVTPPVWSSPSGLFCWLQSPREVERADFDFGVDAPAGSWQALRGFEWETEQLDQMLFRSNVASTDPPLEISDDSVVETSPSPSAPEWSWSSVLFGAWLLASLLVIVVSVIRCLSCWRLLKRSPQRECPELNALLADLAKKLRLQRRVRLIVTESRIGPAVIGLFRSTVLLPALIVDRLVQRSPVAPRQESRTSLDSDLSKTFECQTFDGTPVAERQGYVDALIPILAHELLHIRRGDLWIGLLQTLAQAVWWCHPLVWWVNRLTTRVAERCCDEEVLAELGSDPAAYARALVDVLELKRKLKPMPVFPGVRPVEVTSQRLERIMELGQGCRRRTPWWCWLLAALAAAVTWPGAAFVVTADDAKVLRAQPATEPPSVIDFVGGDHDEATIEGLVKQNAERKAAFLKSVRMLVFETEGILSQLPGTDAEKKSVIEAFVRAHCSGEETRMKWDNLGFVVRAMGADLLELQRSFNYVNQSITNSNPKSAAAIIQSLTQFPRVGLIYKTYCVSGPENELRQFAKEIDDKLTKPGLQPVILSHDQALRFVKQANLPSWINIASYPVQTGLNGRETTIQDMKSFEFVTEVLESGRWVPHQSSLEHGWSLTLNPLVQNEKALQLNTIYFQGRLSPEDAVKMTLPSTGEEQIVPGLNVQRSRCVINLADDQLVVFPIFKLPQPKDGSYFLALQVERAKPTDGISQPATTANPPPRPVRGVGVNSDAGVSGKIVVEEVQIPPENFRPTPSGDGAVRNYITSWDSPKFNNDAPAKDLELDGLGQLLWRHGSWFVVVRPEPGRKLIDGGATPAKFESNGPVRVMLTNMQAEGFSIKNQLRIAAEQFSISSSEHGRTMRFGGDVRLGGHEFGAHADSLVLTLSHNAREDFRGAELSASLSGHVSLWNRTNKNDLCEMTAEKVILFLNGSAISKLERDDKGIVAVLRAPPSQDDMLVRRGKYALAIAESEKLISVDFNHETLKAAMQQLAKQSGRNIHLDPKGLEEEGLTDKEFVTLKLDGVKLNSVLTLALDPLNLGYRVEESGVIVVTSKVRLRGEPVVMTYSVADLVFPWPKRVVVECGDAKQNESLKKDAQPNSIPMYRVVNGNRLEGNLQSEEFSKARRLRFTELIELITTTCDPNSWEEVGGGGSIKGNDSTLSLIVRQTPEVHAQIKDLFEQLRRLQDLQASLHVETLTVPSEFWSKFCNEIDINPDIASTKTFPNLQPPAKDATAPPGIALLTMKEAALLRGVCRPVSAPKVTLFNTQELDLFFGIEPSDLRLGLKPVVSGDRKHLQLQYATQRRDAVLDFAKLSAVTIADGQSLLIDVTDLHPIGPVAGVPILDKVPNQSRLFKNTGKSDRRTLLLITGRLVVVKEETAIDPEVPSESLPPPRIK